MVHRQERTTYTHPMFEILQSETFKRWRAGLKDRQAVLRINARIRRLSVGNPGDTKPVGEGISELRIDYGPGYRVYSSVTARR
jgi:putative addiction module killer protein